MTEVRSAVSEAAAAVAELTGGVRENSGLLRRRQAAADLAAQRGMAAAAMQVRGVCVKKFETNVCVCVVCGGGQVLSSFALRCRGEGTVVGAVVSA